MFSCGNASTANSASKSSNTSKISVSKNDNSKASSVAHDSPTESVTTDEGESGIITNGSVRNCVSVLDYGVVPNLNADQYDKFKRAIDTGKSIYVPAGYYYVSQTLRLRNQNLYGDGMCQSSIISMDTSNYATQNRPTREKGVIRQAVQR